MRHLFLIIAMLTVALAALPGLAWSQQVDCGPDSLVTAVVVEVIGDIVQKDAIVVRLQGFYSMNARAEETNVWVARDLREPLRLSEIDPVVVMTGYKVIPDSDSWGLVRPRDGECVAYFAVSVQRVWRVELDAMPVSVQIASEDFPDGPKYTPFVTPQLMWRQRLSLIVSCGVEYPLVLGVREVQEKKNKMVIDRQMINEFVMRTKKRRNSFWGNLKKDKEAEIHVDSLIVRLETP